MAYYCCLRVSEIAYCKNSSHTLQLQNITSQIPPQPICSKITFPSSKHSDIPISLILNPQQHSCCPVRALLKYLVNRGDCNGPLFLTSTGKLLTRSYYSSVLKSSIRSINIPADRYNTHSFRIGRATDLAMMGSPIHVIKAAGRWRSDAYLKYIRMDQISFPSI